MATLNLRRWMTGVIPATLLFVLLLVSLYLLSSSTQELGESPTQNAKIGHFYEVMVVINVAAIFVLIGLIGHNLYQLYSQYRGNSAGAKLNVRMVLMFVVLSVIPVTLVFYISIQLLSRDVDERSSKYFKQAIDNAVRLSKASLDLRKRELSKQVSDMAVLLQDLKPVGAKLKLDELRESNGATELYIFQGTDIIAFSHDKDNVKPYLPSDKILELLKKGDSQIDLDANSEEGLAFRVAARMPSKSGSSFNEGLMKNYYLYASFPLTKSLDTLAHDARTALDEFKRRQAWSGKLKMSFMLTLTLVLLLSLLTAVWAAFFTTRRLVAPIRKLADATRAVAQGEYGKAIESATRDELGFLVDSFNDMTQKLNTERQRARFSQVQVEAQRAYLQAVLANLFSGVITLDRGCLLQITNARASQILGVDLSGHTQRPLVSLAQEHAHLTGFVAEIGAYLSGEAQEWRHECVIFAATGRQVLLCRGTSLIDDQQQPGDFIVVFDDITTLVKAQRDAAWGEVARRLAHEIKNPLTPIQLSAERLRHKYLHTMPAKDAEVLDRSTHTIVQQVEVMKEMVNAFSEYARAPKMELTKLDLNSLVREVLDLYAGGDKHFILQLELDSTIPLIDADRGRLRQLLNNLIQNALEAMDRKRKKQIDITTRLVRESSSQSVEISIRDYGRGLPEEAQAQCFEPYFTTKAKGTGLGLAIVKRIVEEHGGLVWADNVLPQGARITMRMPVGYAAWQEVSPSVEPSLSAHQGKL